MEQKKKEQDVLIVRNEQTGEIGVVAGLNPDGTVSFVPHPIRKEPNLDEYLNVKFTPEDQENLKKTGNLGRMAEVVDPATGELVPSYISIDRLTNETVSVPVKAIRIPDEVKSVRLTKEQKEALAEGKGVYVENMIGKSGKKFNAYVRPNHKKGKFDFSHRKPEQSQIYEIKQGVLLLGCWAHIRRKFEHALAETPSVRNTPCG